MRLRLRLRLRCDLARICVHCGLGFCRTAQGTLTRTAAPLTRVADSLLLTSQAEFIVGVLLDQGSSLGRIKLILQGLFRLLELRDL